MVSRVWCVGNSGAGKGHVTCSVSTWPSSKLGPMAPAGPFTTGRGHSPWRLLPFAVRIAWSRAGRGGEGVKQGKVRVPQSLVGVGSSCPELGSCFLHGRKCVVGVQIRSGLAWPLGRWGWGWGGIPLSPRDAWRAGPSGFGHSPRRGPTSGELAPPSSSSCVTLGYPPKAVL